MKLGFKADTDGASLAGISGISAEQERSLTDYERRLLKSPYAQPASFDHINGKKRRDKERLLINAVRHLPHEKKVDLLHSLSKLEDELKTPSVVIPGHGHGGGSIAGSSVGRYNGGSVVGDDIGSFGSYDDASMSVSVMSMSSGFVEKNYGIVTESPAKIMQRDVIRCLCKVGKAIEGSDLKHMVGSRDMTEIVGLTALREFLHSRLKCSLTTKEAELVMKFIDTNNRGEVNIYDILGMAQLNYDKLRRQMKKKRDKEIVGAERKELLIRRKNYVTKCEQEKQKGEDSLGRVLGALGEASFHLLVARNTAALQLPRRLVLNSTLFQELLLDFGVNLTLRERKLLELRYSSLYPPRMGSVDYTAFKAEFVSLGAELITSRRKNESMDRFLHALQGMGISSPAAAAATAADVPAAEVTGGGVGGGDAGPSTVETPASDPSNALHAKESTHKVSLSQVLAAAKPSLAMLVKPHGKKRKVPKGGKLEPIKADSQWPAGPRPHESTEPEDSDDGFPPEEHFPGHPDILPAVTKTRNNELRRSFESGGGGGAYEVSAHIRKAVEDMLDPSKIGEEIQMLNPHDSGSLKGSRRDDESKDVVMPLTMVDSNRRRSRRTLERSPSSGPSPLSPIGAGKKTSLSSDAAARTVRRNSHRRVSELIREAQKPGAPVANNMAANLTEQAHAFTSSVAIMNMINYSTELMVVELAKANSSNIGLSSDFSRRFSVSKSPAPGAMPGLPLRGSSIGAMQSSLSSRSPNLDPSVTSEVDEEQEQDDPATPDSTPATSRRPSLSLNTRSRKSSLMRSSSLFDAAASKEARTLLEAVLSTGAGLTATGRRDSAIRLMKADAGRFAYVASVAMAMMEEGDEDGGGDAGAARSSSGAGVAQALNFVSNKGEGTDTGGNDELAAVAAMMTRMAFNDLTQGDTTVTLQKLRLWSFVQELCARGVMTPLDFDELFYAAMAQDEAAKPSSLSITGRQRECVTFDGFERILEGLALAGMAKGSGGAPPLDESVASAEGGGNGDEDEVEDLVGNNSKNPALQ